MNNRRANKNDILTLLDADTEQLLKHLVSPIETAAMKHHYQPFIYDLNGVKVVVPDIACKFFIQLYYEKANLLAAIISENRRKVKVPIKLRKTFDDPRVVMSFDPDLRKKVCKLECYTLFSIIEKGRDYFLNLKGFGKDSVKGLDMVFRRYNSSHLFK